VGLLHAPVYSGRHFEIVMISEEVGRSGTQLGSTSSRLVPGDAPPPDQRKGAKMLSKIHQRSYSDNVVARNQDLQKATSSISTNSRSRDRCPEAPMG
jgi:hypothetical protein